MPAKPKWTHDCERCLFLGSVTLNGDSTTLSRHYDLYVCLDGDTLGHSYIARYDDEGSQYASYPEVGMRTIAADFDPLNCSEHMLALYLAHKAYNRIRPSKGKL